MDAIRVILVVSHFIGLAAIIGPFLFQLRTKTGFDFRVMLGGAIVQLVTGLALVTIAQFGDREMDNVKIAVKLVVALLLLIVVLVAIRRQKRLVAAGSGDRGVLPFIHTAGALAIINVIVAVGF